MVSDIKITPELVRGFWSHFERLYHTRTVPKADATEMKAVASALKLMGILDADAFMTKFVTTLWRRIYVPFTVGEIGSSWSLWDQIVVCVHEHQHVEQLQRDGWFKFTTQYLTSSAKRAMYEAEAYRSDMEMWFWRTGELLSPHSLAGSLVSYNCKVGDIRTVEIALEMSSITVKKGGVINRASQRAIEYLETQGQVPASV